MDTKETTFEVVGFSGLNAAYDSNLIDDHELSVLQNLDVEITGELIPRPSLQPVGNALPGISSGVITIGVLVTATGSSILVFDGSTNHRFQSTEDEGTTWTVRATPAGGNGTTTYGAVQYKDKLYFTHEGQLYSWDGAAIVSIAGATGLGLTALWVHKDRLFGVCGNSATMNRIYYSAIGDFTSWPASNFFDVDPGDGDVVTCGLSYNDISFIFKTRKTYQLTVQGDPSEWYLRMTHEVGAVTRMSACVLGNVVYFLSRLGIYQTNGSELVRISDRLPADIFYSYLVNAANYRLKSIDSSIVCFGNKIVFQNLAGNIHFVYNTTNNTWSEWVWGPVGSVVNPLKAFTTGVVTNTKLLVGMFKYEAAKPKLVYMNVSSVYDIIGPNIQSTDYATTFIAKVVSKMFSFGEPTTKRGKIGFVQAEGSQLNPNQWTGNWVHEDGTLTANIDVPFGVHTLTKIKGPGVFRHIALQLSKDKPWPDVRIKSFYLTYRTTQKKVSAERTTF